MKSKPYLDYIHTKPCLITGNYQSLNAHHCKIIYRTGKKPSDFLCVPLSEEEHLGELHGKGSEEAYWERRGLDPVKEVLKLNLDFISINAFESDYYPDAEAKKRVLTKLIEVSAELSELMEAYAEKEGIEL